MCNPTPLIWDCMKGSLIVADYLLAVHQIIHVVTIMPSFLVHCQQLIVYHYSNFSVNLMFKLGKIIMFHILKVIDSLLSVT